MDAEEKKEREEAKAERGDVVKSGLRLDARKEAGGVQWHVAILVRTCLIRMKVEIGTSAGDGNR